MTKNFGRDPETDARELILAEADSYRFHAQSFAAKIEQLQTELAMAVEAKEKWLAAALHLELQAQRIASKPEAA